jgi:hypothetical protein
MYELLIQAYVEYFRTHPSEREEIHFLEVGPTAGPRTLVPEGVGGRWLAWLQTDSSWTSTSVTRQLQEQMQRLQHAPMDEQRRFETALRHAIAQLDFGEHQ